MGLSASKTGLTIYDAGYLTDLLDVRITAPSNGEALIYSNGTWINGIAGGGGGGMVIGDAVTGGTANRVLFVDASGNLADSADLTFNDTTNVLTVAGTVTVPIVYGASTLTLNANGGTIQFQTGGFDRWQMGPSNDFFPSATNSYNIGGASNRVLSYYGSGLDLVAPTSTSVVATIKGAASQSVPIFKALNSGSTEVFNIGVTDTHICKITVPTSAVEGEAVYGLVVNHIAGTANSIAVAAYFAASGSSGNYALITGAGKIDFNGELNMNSNSIVGAGNMQILDESTATVGNLFLGDTTSSFAAGVGGDVYFAGDDRGQGQAVATFAGMRGIKENSTYLDQRGALIFCTNPTAGLDGRISDKGDVVEVGRFSSAGNLTVTGTIAGSNLSGTNTGDQTSVTGNAGTATALQTARNINGVAFDGTANITVTAAAGTLTGTTLNATVVTSSLTSVGTLANLTVTNPITGSVSGNAATATALQNARTINGTSFDGTGNITVTAAAGTLTGATLNSSVTASSLTSVGTLTSLTLGGTLAMGTNNITSTGSLGATGARLTKGWFADLEVTNAIAGSITGNAATATALATPRNINGVAFDGTANITVTAAAGTLTGATLNSGVTASSLTSVGTLTGLTMGGTLAMGVNSITGTGSLGATGARLTKGWFTDLEVTNAIAGSVTGNAATATALQNARNINGVSFNGTADITVTAAAGTLTGATLNSTVTASSLTSVGTLTSLTLGGTLAMGTNSITSTGSLGSTGSRLTKGWFTDLQVTNAIVGSVTGNAATVTTNANLTGPITSVGNATSVAAQTGTGSTFVMNTSPTLVTPILGVAAATSISFGNEALSTYDEGVFTPVLTTNGTPFTSVTHDALTGGRYIKIGKQVFFQLSIRTDAITVGSANGNLVIGGLPFTAVSSSGSTLDGYGTANIGLAVSWGANTPCSGVVTPGGTTLELYYRATANGAYSSLPYTSAATGADSNFTILWGSYYAAT